jgi:hypothetical protein
MQVEKDEGCCGGGDGENGENGENETGETETDTGPDYHLKKLKYVGGFVFKSIID